MQGPKQEAAAGPRTVYVAELILVIKLENQMARPHTSNVNKSEAQALSEKLRELSCTAGYMAKEGVGTMRKCEQSRSDIEDMRHANEERAT